MDCVPAISPSSELCPLAVISARKSGPLSLGEGTLASSFTWRRLTATLFLQDLSVLGARELFPVGDLHHVSIDLQPIPIGVKEVEGPAPTPPKSVPRAATALRSMDERPLDNLDALATQVCKGLQPLVSIADLQCDVLEGVVAGITVFLGDGGRMGEQDDVVVVVIEAHEGHRPGLAHRPAPRQREPQDVAIPLD